MKRILLPDTQERLVWYLAMEEYVAGRLEAVAEPSPEGCREAFFLWQVPPTVIFGRNQVMEAEVNLDYCRSHGVQLYRRKSGGGCVYADRGNVMISCITDATDVARTFDRYLRRVALSLRHMGLPADRSGRNDVLVDGLKVSGNAFFRHPKASIIHGTMLFDSDFDALEAAITPSRAKVRSKGVSSVRQHVANVRERLAARGIEMDLDTFKDRLAADLSFPDVRPVTLNEEDLEAVREIEKTYLDPAFLEGRNHRLSVADSLSVEGVGLLQVESELARGEIVSVSLTGDYFLRSEVLGEELLADLNGSLKGEVYSEELIRQAIDKIDLNKYFYIGNLNRE